MNSKEPATLSLFRSRTHSRYPRATFARICRDANIDNLRMHDLRRTFATRVLQATGDIAIASHLLNHHSLTATRRYAFHNAATSHAVVSQVIESYDTKMNL
ncbi:tyrosine-type recombinase/integrase [Escherichia coli]